MNYKGRAVGEPTDAGRLCGTFGAIALAAYEPDRPMFARQLLSIQSQTHADFICLISVDGNFERTEKMVREICGGDERFVVLGYSNRLGFHHNFERALNEVPADARWVALSDQDDYWYPEKLAALLPCLDSAALVTGQARVVTPDVSSVDLDPSRGSLTNRKNVGLADLIANNQVTGSLCVFRREVLDVALPFPSLATPSQYHDHWIGLCSLALGGIRVQDAVLQDYVQHGGNVVGESAQRLSKSIRNTLRMVRRYEPDSSPASISRLIYKTGLGWRTLMAKTLLERIEKMQGSGSHELQDALMIYANVHPMPLLKVLIGGVFHKNVSLVRALEIYLGVFVRPYLRKGTDLPI